MNPIQVPHRDQVSPANQGIFDQLKGQLGFVPNLYATFALSDNALSSYLALQGARSSITGRAREVVNLVVSQVNHCEYCLAAHTALARQMGFNDEQILEIRRGSARFDARLDALARLVKHVAQERGQAAPALLEGFFAAGWTQEHLVDVIMAIGDKIISNYLHATTRVPVDFPAAPQI